MKKSLLGLFILLLTSTLCHSQIPVGLKYDCSGYAFNGYFNPLSYTPENKISHLHSSDSYETGYYYDSDGKRTDGEIKFASNRIYFKKDGHESRDRITPDAIKHFVIGVDSFISIQNFRYKDKTITDPVFARFISGFNGLTFAVYYKFTSAIARQYAKQQPVIATYLVKTNDGTTWENLSSEDGFRETALKYFGSIPYLEERIKLGHFRADDILSIIKTAEYYEKYQNSEPVFYDKYWQEVMDGRKSKYFARITGRKDSVWTLEYFKDNTKLFLANYSSFYPNNKNGDFVSYFPDGRMREIITFENNKPVEVREYDNTGSITANYKYTYLTGKKKDSKLRFAEYLSYTDSAGNDIIKSPGTTITSSRDTLSKATYFQKFVNGKFVASYRIFKGDTVFQATDVNHDFYLASLQHRFEYYIDKQDYSGALNENAQGTVLVSLFLDKKGSVISAKLLNHVHPELDRIVEGFLTSYLVPGSETKYKLKPYKVNGVKQFCDVVIPVEFSIDRFYRKPVNYYNYMWMHQPMMNHSFPTPNYRPPHF